MVMFLSWRVVVMSFGWEDETHVGDGELEVKFETFWFLLCGRPILWENIYHLSKIKIR